MQTSRPSHYYLQRYQLHVRHSQRELGGEGEEVDQGREKEKDSD